MLYKYIRLKKQIRSLFGQMKDLTCGNTEKMLDISLIDKDLECLAGVLNQYNAKQRLAVSGALQHEEHLKESIANISHDLRTPLTVILGHLQLLKKETMSAEQMKRVETVLSKAERMKELVETFYSLSVLDTEQVNPQKETFNFSNLLMNLVTENYPALEHKNIRPQIRMPEHSVFLCSDRSMVERILQNLLTNAIRYSAGIIEMSLEQQAAGKITFLIKNTVDSAEEIDVLRLFERFYTADKSRNNGSTGLGLAVVKVLTEKLGGSVKAELQADTLIVMLIL
ncbi:sensor histidine kinase [Bariatricus massiliensis]|uniref:histidine kinase n=1 Tax=Bariatricus massiliensis TaxID=1745713 RepID=A0ABS8DDY9_9FIRM|nr:HAMP domain-containing sensor histidine kinase [Bariatricus massiliensis]MCB7302737.1 HAMP domain-containing histidine kinase [Bariatricus massiliensis]MCB7373953.1 HAMP domain-containing histidine kinase [Bariatricus massiliensis]MCB7386623.1 HAMP domain-containing histidine kinase [Bariatricus massiliensis]MCB7410785.1 HAMP domain-containing histidine kinase [Bariatricus massiliensis]